MESIDRVNVFAPDSMSLDRCRELLGAASAELSDEEIDRIRGQAELLAHAIIDLYLQQRPTIH